MDEFRPPLLPVRGPLRVILAVGMAALIACGEMPASPTAPSAPASEAPPSPPTPPPAPGPAVLVGAGDIALCGPDLANAEATARLLDGIGGTIFTAGDNTQASGSAEDFRDCFGPTWGRHKERIRPAPGNHDYGTPNARPYFDYFGEAAGPGGVGYYSYELGGWHVIALDSNVSMKPGSPQHTWLRQDLQASRSACTAAYWHHPLVSSGPNGGSASVRDAWELLYEFGAELVMNGHDHLFERFAPQDPAGRLDPARGIRQFTTGTGGCFLYGVSRLHPNSEVQGIAHGVLKLTLREGGYDWQFVGVPGSGFGDRGSGACH